MALERASYGIECSDANGNPIAVPPDPSLHGRLGVTVRSRKRRDRDGRNAGVGHESAATWISLKAPLES